jgi:hypothetical protein
MKRFHSISVHPKIEQTLSSSLLNLYDSTPLLTSGPFGRRPLDGGEWPVVTWGSSRPLPYLSL